MTRPAIAACVLCGRTIRPTVRNSWLIIACRLTGRPVLTGVGVHRSLPDDYLVPLNRDARDDQPGFENRDPDLAEMFHQAHLQPRSEIFFHDGCWSLLTRYLPFEDDPQMLQNFYQVCHSLPYPSRSLTLSWGHDYGGLTVRHDKDQYPWEDFRYDDHDWEFPNPRFAANPLDATAANYILFRAMYYPPQLSTISYPISDILLAIPTRDGPLTTCPTEICCHIASFLPTHDFLNIRLASRKFCAIFYLQSFWAARFKGHGERSWFFEATEGNYRIVHWLSLYHLTNHGNLDICLRNRKRIWSLFKHFPEYLDRHWMEPPPMNQSNPILEHVVSGWLHPRPQPNIDHGFEEGCCVFGYRNVSISARLQKIKAYLITFSDASYIAGLELHQETDENNQTSCLRFGYQTSNSRVVSIGFQLQGMILAVGSRGVHAIKFTGPVSRASEWLGVPGDSPKTERLAFYHRMSIIQAQFNGCKLVALCRPDAPICLDHASLHNMAFWYPCVPPSTLHLNNPQFVKALDGSIIHRAYQLNYQPLSWIHFGADNRLSHLTGISVSYDNAVQKITFTYDSLDPIVLGRCLPNPQAWELSFSIDGPGGEIITEIDLYCTSMFESDHQNPFEETMFKTFKVTTNRGRSKVFLPNFEQIYPSYLYPVPIEEGTFITGLYATQQPEFCRGLKALGVISERLPFTHEGLG